MAVLDLRSLDRTDTGKLIGWGGWVHEGTILKQERSFASYSLVHRRCTTRHLLGRPQCR